MRDFQTLLKSIIEVDVTPPEDIAPPSSGFAGKVEDADNASDAFSAFVGEHKVIYNQYKQSIQDVEKHLTALYGHAQSFSKSMFGRTHPDAVQQPNPMKRFDRSRVAALQSDLNGMQKPTVPENFIAEDDTESKNTDFIKQTIATLQTASSQYEQAFGDLLKRTKSKMIEFAGKQSGMAANQEQLQSKIEELQSNFDAASKDVHKLGERVKALETSGRAEDQAEIQKLGGLLSNLSQQLEKKKAEADELSKNLGNISGRASANIEEMLKHIDELEAYGADLHEKYTKLHKLYKGLYERSKAQLSAPEVPEQIQNYGKFDLLEHLSRAKAKMKKNASDW